ncbi:MAG TPA: hypothetical protein VMD92_13155 [Acidobacteriaceae bacterium]|nr:hypothetical protein [Acidobacteriaceae bacterium]
MNRQQMLEMMGISQQDFSDFVTKFLQFRGSLNPAQLSILDRALPTVSEIAQSFGPNCSVGDVEAVLQIAPAAAGIACTCWMGVRSGN